MISPEPFIEKCKSLARSKNPYLEVLNSRIRLAWTDNGVSGFMELADALGLGITHNTLEEDLSEAGGTIDANGRYPINEAIRQRLKKLSMVDNSFTTRK